MGCSCRTFREEPLARPCVSQEEPSQHKSPQTRTRGFPRPRSLPRTRAGFSFWRMTRRRHGRPFRRESSLHSSSNLKRRNGDRPIGAPPAGAS